MSKKGIVTKEEYLEKTKSQSLRLIENGLDHIPEPTYRFNVGDTVYVGRLNNCKVEEVLYDGKVYIISCNRKSTNPWYNIPFNGDELNAYIWTDVRPETKEGKSFTKNDDFNLQYKNASIECLLSMKYSFGFDMDPEYQREYVWSKKDEEKLLDSIFSNLDIGKIVLINIQRKTNKLPLYEVLDGKQRINTICKFYENRIPYKGKYYNDLNAEDKRTFLYKSVALAQVEGLDNETKLKYFIRLNDTGRKMSSADIKKAKKIYMEGIKKIAK